MSIQGENDGRDCLCSAIIGCCRRSINGPLVVPYSLPYIYTQSVCSLK